MGDRDGARNGGSTSLGEGRFYGDVVRRRRAGSVLVSELAHTCGCAFPRHAHERAYLCFLLRGSYVEHVGRRTLAYRPMSVCLHPAAMEHTDEIGAGGGRFLTIELAVDWLAGHSTLRDPRMLDDPALVGTALRLFREMVEWSACSAPIVESLAAELCAIRSRTRDRGAPWLGRVADVVRDRFRENVSLAELAREADVHPAYLSRAFRREFGRTPGELVRELRVERVCRALGGSSGLAEIASQAGFADQAHMTRIFARRVGTTPARMRALLQRG